MESSSDPQVHPELWEHCSDPECEWGYGPEHYAELGPWEHKHTVQDMDEWRKQQEVKNEVPTTR